MDQRTSRVQHKEEPQGRLSWLDGLVALLLAGAAVTALMATMDIGFTRDEGYYFKAAELYLGWFKELADNLDDGLWQMSFTQESVDRHWSYNSEHPALIKALFGLSYWLFHETLDWMSPAVAHRFPATLFAGGLVAMVYLFTAEVFGRLQGVFAAVATLLMPRPFFHAHLACFDYPMVALWFAVLYAWWKGLGSTAWGIACGVLFGVALSTKLNSFFLPFVLILHWIIIQGPGVRLLKAEGQRRLLLPPIPVAFVSMCTLGALVWYALWPRHWFDTFNRIQGYLQFHLNHVHYFQYYFGQNLYQPPFPIEFPFALSLVTMPEVILVAFACGWLLLLSCWLQVDPDQGLWPLARLRRWVQDRRPQRPKLDLDPRGTGWWLLLGGLVPFLVIARPETPIFGGIKHWMPAMPFMAIVASVGAVAGATALAEFLITDQERSRLRQTLAALFLTGLMIPGALAVEHGYRFGTSFYNTLLGGTRGAADAGMMRQFWGYTSAYAMDFFNTRVSDRGGVFFQNTNHDSYRMYQRMGMLRRDIRYVGAPAPAEFGLIHHQMAARNLELELWKLYRTRNPAHVVSYDGVPVLSVYPNTRRLKPPADAPGGGGGAPSRKAPRLPVKMVDLPGGVDGSDSMSMKSKGNSIKPAP